LVFRRGRREVVSAPVFDHITAIAVFHRHIAATAVPALVHATIVHDHIVTAIVVLIVMLVLITIPLVITITVMVVIMVVIAVMVVAMIMIVVVVILAIRGRRRQQCRGCHQGTQREGEQYFLHACLHLDAPGKDAPLARLAGGADMMDSCDGHGE
jgi:hypothetical protein